MKLKISFYPTSRGGSPVLKFIDALDEHESGWLYAALKDLALHGLGRTVHPFRAIEGKLWELKIGRYRIFYVMMTGPELVLLHACKKQGRKARKEDVDVSRIRMREILDGG